MDIEKNEVDISKLFDYKTVVTFNFGKGEPLEIHLKLIGDADMNRARVIALRETSKLRENLEDPEWEDRRAYFPDLRGRPKEHIIEAMLLLRMREIGTQITLNVQSHPPFPYPTEPKAFSPIKEKERFQKEVDSFPMKIKEHISKRISNRVAELREQYSKLSEEEVIKLYERNLIEETCESFFRNRLEELLVFFSIYLDDEYKNRVFLEEDLESFDNLPTQVKAKLIDAYRTIDLPGDELKK